MRVIRRTVWELPPMWDGRRVEWEPWMAPSGSLLAHVPQDACEGCGANTPRPSSIGTIFPNDGDIFEIDQDKKLPSGRRYATPALRPAWPVIALFVERCLSCGLDTVTAVTDVYGMRRWTCWTLDDSDYGPRGSTDGVG